MPRYAILIEYDGTDFMGWQRQENVPSIQATLEGAIRMVSEQTVTLFGCGRTDSGVHALGQVAHFDMDKTIAPASLSKGINYFLYKKYCPDGAIVVKDSSLVAHDFHARFSAIKRYYRYLIVNRPSEVALRRRFAWHLKMQLSVENMKIASQYFLGHQDFSSFRARHCQASSPYRTLEHCQIDTFQDEIHIQVGAKSFLHNQVRIMVGTLVQVGQLKIAPEAVESLLTAKDRTMAGPTAPAKGLIFEKVDYPTDLFKHS